MTLKHDLQKKSVRKGHFGKRTFAKEDNRKYELPGGEVIDLDHKLRLGCGEILFKYFYKDIFLSNAIFKSKNI